MRLEECFEQGLLVKISMNRALVEKTLEMGVEDLAEAERTYAQGRYVWATVQVYTSMLNLARAVLFSDGIRERSNVCTVEYLRAHHQGHYGELIEKLDVLRRERHMTLYDSREHITAEKTEARISWGKEFLKKTRDLLELRKK